MKTVLGVALALMFLAAAPRPETLHVFAAGSLTGAVSEIAHAFSPEGGIETEFGPSGLLRERIEGGARVDVFASADLTQPRRLAAERHLSVIPFIRNRMCLQSRGPLPAAAETLLDRLLDPATRIATSTPGADPGGDYAWAVFARADQLRAGALAALEAKALKLVGGPHTPLLVPGHSAGVGVFLADRADVMLGYCSSGEAMARELPGLLSTPVPPPLALAGPEAPTYGLIVMSSHPEAARFALFMLSEDAQAIFAKFGFARLTD